METQKPHSKKSLIFAIIFTILTIAFTVVVKFINVGTILNGATCSDESQNLISYPCESSSVGLIGLNSAVRGLFNYDNQGVSPTWDKITDLAVAVLFATALYFVILGFVQLVHRKSLKKIDRELKLLAIFYLVVAAIYLLFEKFLIINTRPILIDGVFEPSYPSSHVLFALTLAGSACLLLSKYLKLKHVAIFNVFVVLLALVVCFGRLLAGVHWFTDIFGSVLIAATLVAFYASALHIKKTN